MTDLSGDFLRVEDLVATEPAPAGDRPMAFLAACSAAMEFDLVSAYSGSTVEDLDFAWANFGSASTDLDSSLAASD